MKEKGQNGIGATVTTAAQQVQSLVTSVEKNDGTGAVRKGAELLGFERQDRFENDPTPATPVKPQPPSVTLSDVWTRWEAAQARP